MLLEVHCKEIFKPAQLCVVIGRAKSLDGLRVVNFSTKCCIRQPEEVTQFLGQVNSTNTENEKSCCTRKLRYFKLIFR
ncbi:hypothetical protein DPMN_084961 [Dreissena polymorpha]|uniref:Uncharacterized protein n=1 Tax=Dreissena polymorpha TaxID=45954 RepID=A0A9D3YFW8_DREPO|nr:hypothetical protein DPMN_084961 [Dreissena polymorpha]